MERWRKTIKILIILSALYALGLAKPGYAAPAQGAAPSPASSPVAMPFSASNHAWLPKVHSGWLVAAYAPVAEFAFQANARFDVKSLRVALNGVVAHAPAGQMASVARWELRHGVWVLVLDLGQLSVGAKTFARAMGEIQARGGIAQLWLSSCPRLRAAQFFFVHAQGPSVQLSWEKTPQPVLFSRDAEFFLVASGSGARIECRLNGAPFVPCKPQVKYTRLANGHHRFEARALDSAGNSSRVLQHVFRVQFTPPAVEITQVDPGENPTTQRDVSFEFRRNWTWGWYSSTQCRLDQGHYHACRSGVRYSNLAVGQHRFEVRLVRYFLWWAWVTVPDSYSWEVLPGTAPEAQWAGALPDALTAQTGARFVFEAPGATRFECTLGGAAPTDCTSPWQLEELADGPQGVEVRAFGPGNTVSNPLVHHWVVDTQAPAVEVISAMPQQSPTNLDRLALAYSLSEPAQVECALNADRLDDCASPIEVSGVADGQNVIRLRAVDGAGNASEWVSHAWVVDRQAPQVSIELVFPSQIPTRMTTARFRFVASKDSLFECVLNGEFLAQCGAELLVEELVEGVNRLEVTPTDLAGNRGQTQSFDWEVDTIPPGITLVAVDPAEGITSRDSIELAFAVSEPASTTCNLDEAGPQPCISPFVANALAVGDHLLEVRALDAAGNQAEPLVYRWTIAPEATVQFDSVEPRSGRTNQTHARFEFSSAQGSGFECRSAGAVFVPCTSPYVLESLAEGVQRFEVRAVNAAGVAGEAIAHEWEIDLTPPPVPTLRAKPSDPVVPFGDLVLHFESEGADHFLCRLNQEESQACASPVQFSGLGDGLHRVSVVAVDSVGNQSAPATHLWRVQSAPLAVLTVAVQQITQDSAVVRWTTNFPATGRVEYGLANSFNESTAPVVPAAASQTVVLTGLVPDRLHRARVVATDGFGRTVTSEPVAFTTLR